ncbi:MAG: hypothetical protein AUH81_15610 [Candidatus Rokubacteria bacterium 13_1_40CM_4_69_5]|nr:MAG: hypothetical protein AUH81_15610 [Candidatus Rokubacteria bacterium 13_1_40CM_4_69_5]
MAAEPIRITDERGGSRIERRLHPNRPGIKRRPGHRDRVPDQRDEIQRTEIQADLAGDDLRNRQEVVDDLHLRERVALDRLERAPARVLVERTRAKHA